VGPNQIQRDDAKRRIAIGFNVRGRDVQSIVQEMDKNILAGIKFQPGYFLRYGGSFKNLEEAKQRLFIAVPVALLLIFALLFFTFHSLRQGLLIFTAIPLSAIGGILALWLRNMPFSISAGIGFIALFGIAVETGVVMVIYLNDAMEQLVALKGNSKETITKGDLREYVQRQERGTHPPAQPCFDRKTKSGNF